MRALFTLFLLISTSAIAQQAPQWGNLQKGPYSIGYKTIRLTDPTRHYFETGRPLQLYVWYPATVKTTDKNLAYGAYFDDVPYDWGNDPARVAALKSYFIKDFKSGSLNPSFPGGLHDSTFKKILATPIPVYRNANAASGKFPLVLHAHANGLLHQSVMMEYLASHGYVVVSISMYGSSPAFYGRGEDGNNALLNLTQDLALALAEARKLGFADADRAAMIGMMAQGGLSLQLREMPLKALACLDCDWNPPQLQKLPYYDVKKVRIPIMEVVNTEFVQQQYSFLDSLPYAQRIIGRYNYFAHADFYPFPKIARPAESKGFKNYEYMLGFTLKFLNGVFKKDTTSKAFMTDPAKNDEYPPGFFFVRKKEALPAMPTENEVLTWLRYGDTTSVNDAWQLYGKELFSVPDNLFFVTLFLVRDTEPQAYQAVKMYALAYPQDTRTPGLLNRLTYDLLTQKKHQEALRSASLFVQLYPYSPFAVNAVADVWYAMGNKAKAGEQAKKVLELTEKSNLTAKEKDYLVNNAQIILSQR